LLDAGTASAETVGPFDCNGSKGFLVEQMSFWAFIAVVVVCVIISLASEDCG
jgi:hypothetical protein